MAKIMHINITCGIGSTGIIAVALYQACIKGGDEAWFFHSVYPAIGIEEAIPIETKIQHFLRRGLNKYCGRRIIHSRPGTKRLIREIKKIKPDLIHLHNIQQNSVDYISLFKYLESAEIPVVYTLHDCWAFTGGCYHFTERKCDLYRKACHDCPKNRIMDDITEDAWEIYKHKEQLIGQNENIQIICVSKWLRSAADLSYMHRMCKPVRTIYNGVDTTVFYPRKAEELREEYNINDNEFVVLGVASYWTHEKGLHYFAGITEKLDFPCRIVLVGDCNDQSVEGNSYITVIQKTKDMERLAKIYSMADAFVNASIEETFGMTTAEALACGTPAIVFNSTACPEIVDADTGIVVEPSVESVLSAIRTVHRFGKEHYSEKCVNRVAYFFSETRMVSDYMELYRSMIHGKT